MAAALAAFLIALMPEAASARHRQATKLDGHVRAADPRAAALLRTGVAQSAFFREIVSAIDDTDVIVYVQTRDLDHSGRIQLTSASPGCRYLRVDIRVPGMSCELVASLAHELWHALEIAATPEVRDQESLRRLYDRIGETGHYVDTADSPAAHCAEWRVLHELRDGQK